MTRPTMLALALLLAAPLAAAPAHAQHPAPRAGARPHAAPPDSLARTLAGTWQGTFAAHGQQNDMRLTIHHDSAWVVTMELPNLPASVARGGDVQRERSGLRWTHPLMERACTSWVALRGDVLEGETSCGEGGMTYTLRRR